ncbi:MAG: hypothetical protein LUC99_11390 [Clostridiales bacterium]|nr:hypothetical protein [Clostridiales bacterium]
MGKVALDQLPASNVFFISRTLNIESVFLQNVTTKKMSMCFAKNRYPKIGFPENHTEMRSFSVSLWQRLMLSDNSKISCAFCNGCGAENNR